MTRFWKILKFCKTNPDFSFISINGQIKKNAFKLSNRQIDYSIDSLCRITTSKNSKTPHYRTFVLGIHRKPRGQQCGMCFHIMSSKCQMLWYTEQHPPVIRKRADIYSMSDKYAYTFVLFSFIMIIYILLTWLNFNPAWMSNHMPRKVWMNLLIYSLTSTVQPLKFGNR